MRIFYSKTFPLHTQKGKDVLNNINLKIDKGATVAIVGSTGAGKSTIVNVLGRFYEHERGEIKIEKQKLKTLN